MSLGFPPAAGHRGPSPIPTRVQSMRSKKRGCATSHNRDISTLPVFSQPLPTWMLTCRRTSSPRRLISLILCFTEGSGGEAGSHKLFSSPFYTPVLLFWGETCLFMEIQGCDIAKHQGRGGEKKNNNKKRRTKQLPGAHQGAARSDCTE